MFKRGFLISFSLCILFFIGVKAEEKFVRSREKYKLSHKLSKVDGFDLENHTIGNAVQTKSKHKEKSNFNHGLQLVTTSEDFTDVKNVIPNFTKYSENRFLTNKRRITKDSKPIDKHDTRFKRKIEKSVKNSIFIQKRNKGFTDEEFSYTKKEDNKREKLNQTNEGKESKKASRFNKHYGKRKRSMNNGPVIVVSDQNNKMVFGDYQSITSDWGNTFNRVRPPTPPDIPDFIKQIYREKGRNIKPPDEGSYFENLFKKLDNSANTATNSLPLRSYI